MPMMFSKHLYMIILGYTLFTLAVAGTGIALIITHTGIIMGCLFIIIALFIIGALVKRLNKFNTKLRLFLDAVEDKENMILFNENTADKEMNAFSHSLNRINEMFATAKSESRKQEKFYYSLLEEVPNGVLAWDQKGKIMFINGIALRLLGIEQLTFLRQLELQYPPLKDYLKQAKVPGAFLLQSVEKKQLALSINQMKLESETITLLAIKDISNELSEKESEAWSKLTRVLTHEIMNTIAPIVSLSETLSLRTEADDKIKRGLKVIREQSERLMEFTESYRQLSYMPDPAKRIFSLTESLHNLELLLQSDFENAGIRFTLRSAPSQIKIIGDEKQLSQVFLNLLKNSIQALEGQKGGEIDIILKITDKLYILVIDNGNGIPAELQEKIFVPFFTTKTEGMGIGLSLCRQIIKRHGGNLYLRESVKGKTVFVIEWEDSYNEK